MNRFVLLGVLLLAVVQVGAQEEKKEEKSNASIKPYDKVITSEAQTQAGLFKVHRLNDKVFFEIGDSLQERDMLLAARVSQVSDPSKAVAGEMRRNPILVKFRWDAKNVYLLQEVLNYELTDQESNLKEAFDRNSILPVMETFAIKAVNEDGRSVVFEVTDFFSGEIDQITPFASKGKPGTLDNKSSYISNIQVFDTNVEVQTFFNYTSKSDPFRALVNHSLLLLPREPMRPRLYDRRMNYFSVSRRLFADDGDVADNVKYISRFRLEPKPGEWERYFRGEMVEPEKPIIVYVDNGLPERWRNYVKQGIEDWQKAFEAIGFKNAIQAHDFPDDPHFNPDDLRYTCFRYITNATINAMGPRWIDPRSGEIIRGDVIWYHNVIQKLHDWRLVQCGAVEEEARERVFSDELMGRLIRYAAAHEIGHVLGFQHNMRASYAYPVDSLRSVTFTNKYGTTPSIMDYARFNYIAQPGDEGVELTPPPLGIYDIHAIQWGYKPVEGAQTPQDEYPTLNQWLLEKADDPAYRFSPQFAMGISPDPSAQAEALGDDAIRAGKYGVQNARFVMNHLVEWCTFDNEAYEYLDRIYQENVRQYERYIGHALSYLGGAYQYFGVEGEDRPLFTPVTKQKQKQALYWVLRELVTNEWILNPDIEQRLGSKRSDWVKMNVDFLDKMMSGFVFQRLQTQTPDYAIAEYLSDIGNQIWSFSDRGDNLSQMEMVLQQSYLRNLVALSQSASSSKGSESRVSDDTGEWMNQQALIMPGSARINYIDHFVAMAALQELKESAKIIKARRKGHNKAHYDLLYQIVASVGLK